MKNSLYHTAGTASSQTALSSTVLCSFPDLVFIKMQSRIKISQLDLCGGVICNIAPVYSLNDATPICPPVSPSAVLPKKIIISLSYKRTAILCLIYWKAKYFSRGYWK